MRRVVSSRKVVPTKHTKETKWDLFLKFFASLRVFSAQKKSGAVAPHSKRFACPAVA
jgi:hypothetical protein